ncbi:hypothetical protein HJG60_011330 [Phyllostomus discolor]|uniref:Uncharacterized protein n=1 Tax=Phyllostomus discolor TaxID=89673 RepID=A0A834A7I0_9CHIR|nr:hypothetical protein HJG60_011330 [Phyllostomus discolor]
MCFYPVCIILRPAAALSAAARARSGPGPDSGCSVFVSGPSEFTAGSGAWAEAEFINNPRPPLWGGGAFLTEDTPPNSRLCSVPRLFPSGDRGGEGTGGWSPRESGGASRLDLLAERVPRRSRGEAPPPGTAGLGLYQAPAVAPAAGLAVGPLGPRLKNAPRISSHPYRALITTFSHLKKIFKSFEV